MGEFSISGLRLEVEVYLTPLSGEACGLEMSLGTQEASSLSP